LKRENATLLYPELLKSHCRPSHFEYDNLRDSLTFEYITKIKHL